MSLNRCRLDAERVWMETDSHGSLLAKHHGSPEIDNPEAGDCTFTIDGCAPKWKRARLQSSLPHR